MVDAMNSQVRQFGKLTLLEHMGKGGMASVYRASDNETGRIVAVKIFESNDQRPPELSCKLRDREVRMLISVQHPNIVKYYESGQVDDSYYYTMEFVENSLLKCMRSGVQIDLPDKVHILRQAASALAAIHQQGIVHRDIKPGNILLDRDPNGAFHVKLTDLGIAKNVSEADIIQAEQPARVPGTAKYLSPEQIRREAVDGRADVFSLGVVAYELLTGTAPFKADSSKGYLEANLHQTPPPVRDVNPDVPDYLARVVEKMLSRDREERYDSETLARDLELVHQHMISGAPLVERNNPGSLFYDALAATEGEEIAVSQPALGPLWWALAFAIVAAGGVVIYLLWPRPTHGQAYPLPAAPPQTSAARLEQALAAFAAGRHWQALVALQGVAQEELTPEQVGALDDLRVRAQEALAEESYRAALTMLESGRDEEAQIVLQHMQASFPEALQTRRLALAVNDRLERLSREQLWGRLLADSYEMIRRGQYKEAFEARRKLLDDFGSDPDKSAIARRALGDLLEQWSGALLARRANPEALQEFLELISAHRSISPDRPSEARLTELRLRLADEWRRRGEHERALGLYEEVASGADSDATRAAARAAADLRRWLAERPYELSAVAAELQGHGLASKLWSERTDPGASQAMDEAGVLRMAKQAGERESVAERQLLRPFRRGAFTTGVEFRCSESLLSAGGLCRVGIGLTATNGTAFEFAFDGQSYRINTRTSGISGGSSIAPARGDEAQAWHTLAIRYDPNAQSVAVLLDGAELRRYPLQLSDARLRIFLAAGGTEAVHCDFKGLFFRLPEGGAP